MHLDETTDPRVAGAYEAAMQQTQEQPEPAAVVAPMKAEAATMAKQAPVPAKSDAKPRGGCGSCNGGGQAVHLFPDATPEDRALLESAVRTHAESEMKTPSYRFAAWGKKTLDSLYARAWRWYQLGYKLLKAHKSGWTMRPDVIKARDGACDGCSFLVRKPWSEYCGVCGCSEWRWWFPSRVPWRNHLRDAECEIKKWGPVQIGLPYVTKTESEPEPLDLTRAQKVFESWPEWKRQLAEQVLRPEKPV